ncbi:ABC transporter substrate-binding protein [Brachybacterium sp. AOP43-C2-M15]|uniref:ABC transporter substrate-binding protein n=1 Tax=Brachybacterium sp. AOP43-C2-M15 TaxID=3457661 RepID=UPI0040347A56
MTPRPAPRPGPAAPPRRSELGGGTPLRRRTALTGLAGLVGLTAACGTGGTDSGAGAAPGAAGDGTEGYPLALANCETPLRFDAPPERIVLLESSPVTTLDGIGVLDRVVSRAGAFPPGYYDEDLAARIQAIPALSEDVDASGHLLISQETVIAQQPDIVFGLPDGVTREAMADAGAQVVVQEAFCGSGGERASFESLHSSIGVCGRIFDRTAEAEELIAVLRERTAAVSEAAGDLSPRTAAVLYPSVGGGPLYTYGAASMVTAQLDALGIENSFASTAERVVEISAEPLLDADPDLLIVLHQGEGDGSAAVAEMIAEDQLASLRAVQEQAVLPLLFNFAEPASPLVVDGLERIRAWLSEREG